jgi:hypothetical protein
MKNIERASRFVDEARAIQGESANSAGSVAYVARVLAQVTLPHSKTDAIKYERTSGNVTIAMKGDPDVGLPFGTYPRLILAWMATEAKLTKSPVLEMGDSLSAFMRELNLVPTGGRWGSVTRLRDQLNRLFETTITWTTYDPEERTKTLRNVAPVREAKLWWDPKRPSQADLWQSVIRLDQEFYEALVHKSVPVDMRALKILAHERSPLALDIYSWLTYRMSYLEAPTLVPWTALQDQFGGNFARKEDFKRKFLERMRLVQELYPSARVRPSEDRKRPGLILEPSPTHVPKLVRPKLKALPSKTAPMGRARRPS